MLFSVHLYAHGVLLPDITKHLYTVYKLRFINALGFV